MALPIARLRRLCGQIRFLLADCDGVLTDGAVLVGERGQVLRRFHPDDAAAAQEIRDFGIEMVFCAPGDVVSPAFLSGATWVTLTLEDIADLLDRTLREVGGGYVQMAYVAGSTDAVALRDRLGFLAAPAGAPATLRDTADLVLQRRGGEGVLREVADLIAAGRSLRRVPPRGAVGV